MKCKWANEKMMKMMLIVGLVMMIAGGAAAYFLPEEAHLMTKLAGMVSGMGMAFAVIGGAVLLRRKRLGEERAKDSELAMTDERGVMVAYKAQSVTAIAAMLGIVAIMITATMRGDTLYMTIGLILCFAIGAIKLIAMHIYNKIM
ncbi:MAG: hypothetical protein IKV90_06855 [Clostridia bacterium]|nr:hypothetical protein [Clostridia bacterium]